MTYFLWSIRTGWLYGLSLRVLVLFVIVMSPLSVANSDTINFYWVVKHLEIFSFLFGGLELVVAGF